MRKILLIGLSGKIGCGKSYLADILSKRIGLYKLSFGYELKKETSEAFNFPLDWCNTVEGKNTIVFVPQFNCVKTVRELLQYWGTDVRRKENPNYWIEKVKNHIKIMSMSQFIIDDVRFPNEADFIKEQNGILIRLNPYPNYIPDPNSDHKSENALDDYENFDLKYTPEYGSLQLVANDIVTKINNLKLQ